MKEIIHYAIVLLIIAGTAGIGLHGVNELTRDKIAAANRAKLIEGQKIAYPGADSFSDPKDFTVNNKSAQYFEVYDADKNVIGYELLYAVQGYQSLVKVLTGITPDGTIKAIRVLEQAETPGLGAEVEAVPSSETVWQAIAGIFTKKEAEEKETPIPAFQAQFAGKTVDQLKVVKEKTGQYIEAISGATITSDAVTKAVREPIKAFMAMQQESKQ
jgi:electron transport complex protein RnfG